MKKHLFLILATLMPMLASAETVEIGGIWYNIITKGKVAEVTGVPSGGTKYSGDITIPTTIVYENVEYNVTSIGIGAFWGSALTSITIPESVTSIGNSAFGGCLSLTSVHIHSIEAWCNISFAYNPLQHAHNLYLNGELVTNLVIPESVNSIENRAFCGCHSLTSISFSENSQLTSIGDYAFSNCSGLTAITIPESVTSIGERAFEVCGSLSAITFPENSQLNIIGNYAFSNCNSLTTITISENSQLTSIGENAFLNCSSLTAITIPENLESIGSSAFFNCSSLVSITIPENLESIGSSAFSGCSSLTNIIFPKRSKMTNIKNSTFNACSNLTNVIIPEGVTNIENYAFYYCSKLATIKLPNSIEHINNESFAGCPELTDVHCNTENVPSTATNAFKDSYIEYATLHVPAGAIESYKSTTPWSSFGKFETMSIAVEKIILSQSLATLTEGKTLSLTATVSPDDADDKSIFWSSSNPSVATVDNTGMVTALSAGSATITAKVNDGSEVSASCEVTVTPASYVITFLIDGEVLLTDTLTRGTAITLPEEPVKEGHTFSGWGEVPETMPTEDLTIEGSFIVNKYLVTFKIGDEVIAADSLEYGATIVAPEAPEKEGHTFNGWGEVAENVPANDVTYESGYSVNSYLLTIAIDGEMVESDSIAYGTTITLPEAPAKEGYTFSGWSEIPETMPAEDITINGTFTINKYLVTFMVDDIVLASDSLEYGTKITSPSTPPNREGYTFSGWGEVAEIVPANDVTYIAYYIANVYKVYYFVGAKLVNIVDVAYGEAIPEYIYEPEEGYTFLGWVGDTYETMPAHDVTYTANIESEINQITIDNGQLNIYDLMGRKVTDTENLTGGIYIIGGKKVIIK